MSPTTKIVDKNKTKPYSYDYIHTCTLLVVFYLRSSYFTCIFKIIVQFLTTVNSLNKYDNKFNLKLSLKCLCNLHKFV